jgi:hypothetical protein
MLRRVSALALCSLSACSTMVTAQAGPTLLATPRANTMIAGEAHASVHAGPAINEGAAVLVGAEVNGRATNDYGHGSMGLSLGLTGASDRVMFVGRAMFSPFGLSARNASLWYALGGGLELTAGYALNDNNNANWVVARTSHRRAVTLSLRGDVEFRPNQQQADLWIALLFGFAWHQITAGR